MATTIVAAFATGHADMVHDAQLDFYGRRLATCSSDRSVKIFDVAGDEHVQTGEVVAHEGPVWQVAWAHPQFGVLLASCGYDRRVVVQREVAPGSWMKVLSHEAHGSSVNGISWAPHEYGLQLACASSDGTVSILTHKGACAPSRPAPRCVACSLSLTSLLSSKQTTIRGTWRA